MGVAMFGLGVGKHEGSVFSPLLVTIMLEGLYMDFPAGYPFRNNLNTKHSHMAVRRYHHLNVSNLKYWIVCYKKLPEHGIVLQVPMSVFPPEQVSCFVPGLLSAHVRIRNLLPPPHVTVQVDQASQLDQPERCHLSQENG